MSIRARHPLMLSTLIAAKRLRRGVALLACVGVLGWALLSATHWHDPADRDAGQHGAAECVLCLGSATGATPPAHAVLRLLPPPQTTRVVAAAAPSPLSAPPSSYQSRAPPAA